MQVPYLRIITLLWLKLSEQRTLSYLPLIFEKSVFLFLRMYLYSKIGLHNWLKLGIHLSASPSQGAPSWLRYNPLNFPLDDYLRDSIFNYFLVPYQFQDVFRLLYWKIFLFNLGRGASGSRLLYLPAFRII